MEQHIPLPPIFQSLEIPNGEVILFGSGLLAAATIHVLKQHGIVPRCVVDTSESESTIADIPVLPISEAHRLFLRSTVILTIPPKAINDTRAQLSEMGWKHFHNCVHLLGSFKYDSNTFQTGLGWLHYELDQYFYEYFRIFYPEFLLLPSIDIVITEKCSLKCRDCANLMQYYQHPQHADYEQLFASLDLLMECVDHVLEFRVLGGETFMNKRAYKYIQRLQEYAHHTRIAVYSNGTIVPNRESLRTLSHERIFVRISDYGSLSRNITRLTETLDRYCITYEVDKMDGWHDCATIAKRERTTRDLEAVFSDCCANKLFTLLKGRLYQCPFAANAENIGALPPSFHDSLALDKRRKREEVRAKLVEMLTMRKYISACKFCAGRPFGALPLPIAIQTSKPLPYKKMVAY